MLYAGKGSGIFVAHRCNELDLTCDQITGGSLLLECNRNIGSDIDDLAGTAANTYDGLTSLTSDQRIIFRNLDRTMHVDNRLLSIALNGADDGFDLCRCLGGALGKFPYLIGHHGKATPGFPCTGRFDGCIQGQQIGLIGNILDHTRYAADLL